MTHVLRNRFRNMYFVIKYLAVMDSGIKKKDGTFTSPETVKRVHGFQTGDMVKATIPKGKYQGMYIDRLASVRASDGFSIKAKSGMVNSNYKYLLWELRICRN